MAESITLDELLQACRDAGFSGGPNDEGKTTEELAGAWKCSMEKTRRQLKAAQRAGIVRVGLRETLRLDGRRAQTPVYSFVFPKVKSRRGGRGR